MLARSFAVLGVLTLGALAAACTSPTEDPVARPAAGTLDPSAKATQSPKLNLSHIACTPDGNVVAHFVLLFAGNATPGNLTGTYSGGAFGPVAPSKSTGNVWHYNVILPSGDIEILSAQVVAKGSLVTLHNPGEYSGNYQCDEPPPAVCPVQVVADDLLCTAHPLTNPGEECGYFGLVPTGKDDGLSGLSHPASQDAYLAIVKSGSGGCAPGESAYRIYVNVSAGDPLATPAGQDISHVTYCACPVE